MPAAPTAPPSPKPLSLSSISLRHTEDGGDRGLVIGGVEAGKSKLCYLLGQEFVSRYSARKGRQLIVDTKPRYRAEWLPNGLAAAPRYRKWSHGQFVRGSMLVERPADLKTAWKLGIRTCIVQMDSDRELSRVLATVQAYLDDSRGNRPQLANIDETLDFYHSNGAAREGTDVIAKLARAGRERGTSVLYGSQRTRGIPATLMAELRRLYALRLDFKADAKRYQEMGAPEFAGTNKPHEFYYWTKTDYDRIWGPYKLAL